MWYYYGAVGGNRIVLLAMVPKLDLSNPQSCLWWFQTGSPLVGGSIAAVLWGEYLARINT